MTSSARFNLPARFMPLDIPMMLLSIFSVVAAFMIALGNVSEETYRVLLLTDTAICYLFLSHWLYGFFYSKDKKNFFKQHWIDLIASIPFIESLRIARIFHVLRVIRAIRASHAVLRHLLRRENMTLSMLVVLVFLALSVSSILILLLEAPSDASNIKTAEQALWWSLVTISTVGYGDYYPVTTAGKIFGGFLIFSGVSCFGLLSGYMASFFTQPLGLNTDEEKSNDISKGSEGISEDEKITGLQKNIQNMMLQQELLVKEIKQLKDIIDNEKNKVEEC